jgi:hypothetical protein
VHKKASAGFVSKTGALISEMSYRQVAESLSTFGTISHQTVWSIVQRMAEQMSKPTAFETIEKEECEVLFEEADGCFINMQGKHKPPKGKQRELKVASFYTGFKETPEGRYERVSPHVITGFESPKDFFEKKEKHIANFFEIENITHRIINADGANWISETFTKAKGKIYFQLDKWHKYHAIKIAPLTKGQKLSLRNAIYENDYKRFFTNLAFYITCENKQKKKRRLQFIYDYFWNNRKFLVPVFEREDISLPAPPPDVIHKNPGTSESTNLNIVCLRMKKRKCSWSEKGATAITNLIALRRERILEWALGISVNAI